MHRKKHSINNQRSVANKPSDKRKKMTSEIDPNRLIQLAKPEIQEVHEASWTYRDLAVNEKLRQNILAKGYETPSPIQEKAIAPLIAGQDLIGIASTGTGKTAAFLIPIIEQMLSAKEPMRTLIMVPTRELALQVEVEFKSLSKGLNITSSSFIGGTNVERDVQKMRRRDAIIIGTPGRLIDMMDRGVLKLSTFNILVLDEFDRMLDMGFINDVKKITSAMNNRNQTLLFSATMDKNQQNIIDGFVKNPLVIQISSGKSSSEQVNQNIIRVPEGKDKFDMLMDLISGEEFEKVILFAETKRLADRVSRNLNKKGVQADQIHGDKSQNYRVNALNKFRDGRIRVLVATDVAARGIDVSNVTHVINYQLPRTYDSYIHRIGRTGRAGKTGEAYTFVD